MQGNQISQTSTKSLYIITTDSKVSLGSLLHMFDNVTMVYHFKTRSMTNPKIN